jgi:hypothetical protein
MRTPHPTRHYIAEPTPHSIEQIAKDGRYITTDTREPEIITLTGTGLKEPIRTTSYDDALAWLMLGQKPKAPG